MGKHAHRSRRRIKVFVALVAGLSLLLGGTAYAAFRYDAATRERIMPGVSVGGVDVGGMTRQEALAAVNEAVERRLDRDMEIRVASQEWSVSPAELGGRADISPAIDDALAVTGEYGWVSRVTRRLFGRPVDRSFELSFAHDPAQVQRFIDVVAGQIHVPPVLSRIDIEDDGELRKVQGQQGQALEREVALADLTQALEDHDPSTELAVRSLKPKAKVKQSPYTIVIRIDRNRLILYKGLKKVKRYSVATGSPGFPTPKGEWKIWHKAVNPTWINPAPNGWGAGMPRSIPGGPGGPLGTRALYLDAPGIRIHGTPNSDSIGTYASHGCIRMLMPNVEELYEIVPINTRVLIV